MFVGGGDEVPDLHWKKMDPDPGHEDLFQIY